MYNGIKIVSSINGVGRTGPIHAKKMKLNHQFIPYTRKNSKRLKDLNISHDTIKVSAENIGSKISDIPYSNIFDDIFPRAREIKGKINKWDYVTLKSFRMVKETIIKIKRTYGKTYLPITHQTRV